MFRQVRLLARLGRVAVPTNVVVLAAAAHDLARLRSLALNLAPAPAREPSIYAGLRAARAAVSRQ